ncbi:MAG: hypothetical protein WC716_07390 [Chitinophagaceae bacterium]|jgi:hypothetical protein
MKNLILTICLLMATSAVNAQQNSGNPSLQFVFSKIHALANRVDLNKDPDYYILRDPKSSQWEETLTFETSDRAINIPMAQVTKATVVDYGIILTGPIGEAILYMDIEKRPELRAELQDALNNYIDDAATKEYTVYEKTTW